MKLLLITPSMVPSRGGTSHEYRGYPVRAGLPGRRRAWKRHMKLIIEPGRTAKNYWRDLWQYRELMYFLAWRDIAVRYKQTIIGVAWALIRPALTMLVFVGFRRMAGFPRGGVPEPILVFAAVLPWQFFSTALSEVGRQPDRQCQPHFQGVFSAPHHPVRGRGPQPR